MEIFGITMTSAIWFGLGILVILYLFSGGMLLKKAEENPWKILIPFYGQYCLYKIANAEGVFWGSIVVSVISNVITRSVASNIARNTFFLDKPDTTPIMIITIITSVILLVIEFFFTYKLAEIFGKGKGFAIGLLLLFPVFALILAFGSSVYNNNYGLNKVASSTGTWKCSACGTENPQSRETCQNCGGQKQ